MKSVEKIANILKEAWESKDQELLISILARRLYWREGTYSVPLRNSEDVIAQWSNDLKTQSDIKIKIKTLAINDPDIYYHCRGAWKDRKKGNRELDGIFQVRLNDNNQITYFNQWWTERP